MGVQVAAEVVKLNDTGQGPGAGRFDLTAVLAQCGQDPRETQPCVDRLLRSVAARRSSSSTRNTPYSESFKPALARSAQPHVVGLRAGEVLQRRTPYLRRTRRIDLNAFRRHHGRASWFHGPARRHERRRAERIHDRRRIVGRDQQVEIADRISHPSERARSRPATRRGVLAARPTSAPRGRGPLRAGSDHRLLGARGLHGAGCPPSSRRNPSGASSRCWCSASSNSGNDEMPSSSCSRAAASGRGPVLRAEIAGLRDLRSTFVELVERPVVDELEDLRRDRRADGGDRIEALLVEPGNVEVIAPDRARRLFVIPHPVRVATGDRQQVRVLGQRLGNSVVRARHLVTNPTLSSRDSLCGPHSRSFTGRDYQRAGRSPAGPRPKDPSCVASVWLGTSGPGTGVAPGAHSRRTRGVGVVVLGLAGDTMLGRLVGDAPRGRRPARRWSHRRSSPSHSEADLFLLNLECCISDRGEPLAGPGQAVLLPRTARCRRRCWTLLGVDCVTLANNHALDYGPTALLDTLGHLERRRASRGWAPEPTSSRARAPRARSRRGLRLGSRRRRPTTRPTSPPDRTDPASPTRDLRHGVPDWLSDTVTNGRDRRRATSWCS